AHMTVLIIVLAALAVARVTRLVTEARLLEPLRLWLAEEWPAESQRLYLLHCPWCVGMWVSIAGARIVWSVAHLSCKVGVAAWLGVPLLALDISHVVGVIKGVDR